MRSGVAFADFPFDLGARFPRFLHGVAFLSTTHSCGDPRVGADCAVSRTSPLLLQNSRSELYPTVASCCFGTHEVICCNLGKKDVLSHDLISARILPELRMER